MTSKNRMSRIRAASLVCALGFGFSIVAVSARAEDNKPKTNGPAYRRGPASAAQQLGMARSVVARGQDLAQRLMHMVDEARREGDVIRLTCLNDKLQQANANVGTAQGRLEEMSKATDADSRGHEFTVISVIGQKLQTLDQEANQCVGQDLYETGATKVQTEIDRSMIPFDTTSGSVPVLLPPGVPSVPGKSSGVK
jgi:hypothetical protein